MAHPTLHLLAGESNADEQPPSPSHPCRRWGCIGGAADGLGFCDSCLEDYHARTARRRRLVELVCARLTLIGDPLFAAFGHRQRALGAHVVGHLEELDARHVHVPPAAVSDYLDELDEGLRRSG